MRPAGFPRDSCVPGRGIPTLLAFAPVGRPRTTPSRRVVWTSLVVVGFALAAALGGCAPAARSPAPGPPAPVASEVASAADAIACLDYLQAFERQDPAVREREEPRLGPYAANAVARWPDIWQFREYLAAHGVRTGDAACAQAAHAAARELYMENPLYDDPRLGWRSRVAVVGIGRTLAGPVGALTGDLALRIMDATAEDAVVPFPEEPAATAWMPPPTAHRGPASRPAA